MLPGQEKGQIELDLRAKGIIPIGVDEVGRGCIAGPVFAAAVALDYERLFRLDQKTLGLIRDSKTLSPKQRQGVLPIINDLAFDAHLGVAEVSEIETMGIVPATFLAMKRALQKCTTAHDLVLVDGCAKISDFPKPQQCIIRGDGLCFCIAAASIIAKEARDQHMHNISKSYPNYGFERHVGYGTKFHLEMIKKFGLSDLHRKNFAISI